MKIPAKARNVRGVRETCPACKRRTRWPEHPLCPSCNKRFINEQTQAIVTGGEIRDRLKYAMEKAEESLRLLSQERQDLEGRLREIQKPFWQEAHEKVREELRAQDTFVDSKVFNKAKGTVFQALWEERADQEDKKLARRVWGMKRAEQSLKKFLASARETIRKREQARTDAVEISSAAGADE